MTMAARAGSSRRGSQRIAAAVLSISRVRCIVWISVGSGSQFPATQWFLSLGAAPDGVKRRRRVDERRITSATGQVAEWHQLVSCVPGESDSWWALAAIDHISVLEYF